MSLMKTLLVINWILVIIGSIIGVLIGFNGIVGATGAPQEAVAICFALACSIVPYCWARAWDEIVALDKPKYNYQKLNK